MVIQSTVSRVISTLHEASLRNVEFTEDSLDLTTVLPHVEAEEENYCCICMADINKGQIITILNCVHKFHSQCVDI